jgi:hypothetical protein
MKGLLVRVGIDQAYGYWNAPVDPQTGAFAYVAIPDHTQRPGLETPYHGFRNELAHFPGVALPARLLGRPMHLDPDFEHLTYGDTGARRGRSLAELGRGDLIAFYAGLRPTTRWRDPLLYGLIGLYRVRECVPVPKIPRSRWHENAHTRRVRHHTSDLVVWAEPSGSGRLERCIEMGEWRDGAYRVRRDLLVAWGGLSCKDGYIQRSAVPPAFLSPERFLEWFERQEGKLMAENNPSAVVRTPLTLVYKRTHNGDPDRAGRFGAFDCMGAVRAREYDAVIGVGGIGDEPRRHGIAARVNWIGIGPHKEQGTGRGPTVTFDHFRWFGKDGRRLVDIAPALADHIYGRNVRSLMTFTQREAREVRAILALADDAPPSLARTGEAVEFGDSHSAGAQPGARGRGRVKTAAPSVRCKPREGRR